MVPLNTRLIQIDWTVFFSALSCGIVFKSCGKRLPIEYRIGHVYHDFEDEAETGTKKILNQKILEFYSGEPMKILNFGHINSLNSSIYSVKIFGIREFQSSLTIAHEFFGSFRVTSMLSRQIRFTSGMTLRSNG